MSDTATPNPDLFIPETPLESSPAARTATPEAWAMAAQMLACGRPVREVAAYLGCSRTTVWRAIRRSAEFRERVELERMCLEREINSRVQGLRALVAETLADGLRQGNLRVALFLAKQFAITKGSYASNYENPERVPDFSLCDDPPPPEAGVPPVSSATPPGNRFHPLHSSQRPGRRKNDCAD